MESNNKNVPAPFSELPFAQHLPRNPGIFVHERCGQEVLEKGLYVPAPLRTLLLYKRNLKGKCNLRRRDYWRQLLLALLFWLHSLCLQEPRYLQLLADLEDNSIFTVITGKKQHGAPTDYTFCFKVSVRHCKSDYADFMSSWEAEIVKCYELRKHPYPV